MRVNKMIVRTVNDFRLNGICTPFHLRGRDTART
jgi:hypothetical protein